MIISKILSPLRKLRQEFSETKIKTAQQKRLFSCIEGVVLSESEQALEEVLKRCPELLQNETIEQIGRMAARAREAGNVEDAEVLGVALMRLITFGKDIEARWNTPKITSNVSWAIKTRKYFSLREKEFLDEATVEANEFPEIHKFLNLLADKENILEYGKLGDSIAKQLEKEGRDEEALTVKLAAQHELACTIEKIDEATTEQKEPVTKVGLNRCQEAIRIARMLDDKLCQAFYTGVLGTYFWKTNSSSTADIYFEKALILYREAAQTEPRSLRFLAVTLGNLGNTKVQLQCYLEAKTSFEEALAVFRNLASDESNNVREDMARVLVGLGSINQILGHSTDSEKSFAEALEIFRSLSTEYPKVYDDLIAMTLSNLSNTQRTLDRFVDAENSLEEALRLYRELDREFANRIPQLFDQPMAQALNNLANIKRFTGSISDAEDLLNKALELSRSLVSREPNIHNRILVLTLLHLGAVQEEKENFAAAERYLNEAIELEKQSLPPSQHQYSKELAGLFQNLGNAQRGNGKLLEAEQSYASGLRIRRNLVRHDPDIFSQDLALSLRNFGDLRLAQNNLREAEKLLSEAKDLVEKIREKALTIDERNRLMQDNDLTYIALLECYVKLKDRKKVLEIAEQGKSRSLSDLLNLKSSDWQPKAPTPDTVVEVKKLGEDYSRIVRELQQIERYETFLSEYLPESNVETTEQWHEEKLRVQNEKFAKHSEFERVLADIAKYDKNFPPKARHIDTETIFEISRNLKRTIVMFRILRKSTAIIFVFPNSELQIEEVMGFGQQEMFDLFREHWFLPYAQWKQGDVSDVDPWQGAIVRMLDLIYERLLGHVHRTLKKKSGSREILFVPTKSLARLPLHAASWTNSNGKKHYLCEEYTISYAPSVSVFKRCLENEKQRSNTALLIADPTADLAASAAEEVACIQQLIPQNNKLAGPDASKSRVMAALQEDYGFTHFCCHGFYSQANPFDSGLYMHHDEVIWLSDIINCNLQNNWLTTLSACETGMVDFQSPTDEHFSLPLGFIFAGSPSVWASLWMVSNQATSTLMQRAYENLNSEEYKNNKPEALRQAQLSMLDDSHPFYWASFQHFGI